MGRKQRWPVRAALLLCFLAGLAQAQDLPKPVVNDVSQINPIAVERIVAPISVDEIQRAVGEHTGKVSIGGGRFSMGGQIATENSLHIDMRKMTRILDFSKTDKRIVVEAGCTWRQIQEYIDPHGLSLKIMQSYANFTVGGSLSVNAHGRYMGLGPIVLAVERFKIVLADGSLVEASATHNSEIFYGAIGGYGGLGVIVEVTMKLVDNEPLARESVLLPRSAYRSYFQRTMRGDKTIVLHNGTLYPPRYDRVRVVNWRRTDRPLTVMDRLRPKGDSHWLDRQALWLLSEVPFGKELRQHVVDPLLLRRPVVVWRNFEASYDVAEVEPSSRKRSTYVLQEYFVPLAHFDDFVSRMAAVLRNRRVNVINIAVRHANPDPGTLLAWAREEVFAFVIYYKQGITPSAKKRVATWTRELIGASLSVGGSYYLPYQVHATSEQFHRAYPRADEFFALKRRFDPLGKFSNKLWDKYYVPGEQK